MVRRSVGLFVICDSYRVDCQNGVAEVHGPQTSGQPSGSEGQGLQRKALFLLEKGKPSLETNFPKQPLCDTLHQLYLQYRLRRVKNFFVVFFFFRHPWSFLTVKGNPSSSVEDHIEYHGNKWREAKFPPVSL